MEVIRRKRMTRKLNCMLYDSECINDHTVIVLHHAVCLAENFITYQCLCCLIAKLVPVAR